MRSAQIMGLRVAGVDMLEGNDGPLVMEVNSSPGLEGIERATQLDIAGAIIDYIDNQVAFPEIDVRQRLTVSTGYGVAEIVVQTGSDLVGTHAGRVRAARPRHHRAHPAPRHQRDPQPATAATCSRPATGCSASASSRRCAR